MKDILFIGSLICWTTAAAAQDALQSPYEATAQTQFVTQQSRINNHMYNSPEPRAADSRPTRAQINACRKKAIFRQQDGPNDPMVRKLYRLCRGIGM